jgi:hypothetical protein
MGIAYLLDQSDGVYRIMTSQSTVPAVPDPGPDQLPAMPPALLQELCEALRAIRYGAIELVIHDGRVVQLERREKVRFDVGLTDQRR